MDQGAVVTALAAGALSVRAIDDWLFGRHLPIWRSSGWDRKHGGFHERLDRSLSAVDLGYKRLLVQCRQLYAHSHAALLGRRSDSEAVAREGLEFLLRHYRDHRHGGWYFTVTPEGTPADRGKDFYAHAFVLFAMGYHYRAWGDARALDAAHHTMEVLDCRLRDRTHGGFYTRATESWQLESGSRLQNPHMHLLEGLLSMHRANGEAGWQREARAIVELYVRRFVDRRSGTLGEYFLGDWRSDPKEGHRVEPGHQFEWYWLLRDYAGHFADPEPVPTAERMLEAALRLGVDAKFGGVFDEIDRQGNVLKDGKRIWPSTERIKALASRHRLDPTPASRTAVESAIRLLVDRYLRPDGTWIEHQDREFRVTDGILPGSTTYHIMLALLEARDVLASGSAT
jgi:mannose/cellobiose epimerase-like protein (N-acyl-D-glucosamine 2-epimerase family)